MSNAEIRGRFVWHELMTTDPQAAGAFYSKVLSWKTQPSGMPDYTLWVSGKTQTGGLMAQPESARQSGAPPSWRPEGKRSHRISPRPTTVARSGMV